MVAATFLWQRTVTHSSIGSVRDGVPRVIGRTADRKHAAQLLFVFIIEMMANRLSSALKIVPKSWMEQTPGGFFPPAMQPRAHERASFASLHLTRHDPHGGSELSKDTTKFCASSPNKPPRTSTGHWPAFKALRTAGCRTVLRTALGVRLANLDNSATPAKKNRCHLMRTACSVNAYSSDRHQQRLACTHDRHYT